MVCFFILSGCQDKNYGNSTPSDVNDLKQLIVRSNGLAADSIFRLPDDSIRLKLSMELSLHYLIEKDSLSFRKYNEQSLELAENYDKLEKKAEAHWDLAYFFSQNNVLDSSYVNYYRAYKEYELLKNKNMAGRMLLNMAISQEKAKDYIGSENTSINALRLISSEDQKQIYRVYNNLAVVFNGLENHDLSLKYHIKALNLAEELENNILVAQTLNNIGAVYQNIDNYKESIEYFRKAFTVPNLKNKDYQLYGIVMDNLAYSKFKIGDTLDFHKTLKKAIKIRDSIGYDSGVVTGKLHLGEYKSYSGDTAEAIWHSRQAYELAKQINQPKLELESLLQLAALDLSKASTYYKNYIRLNDSLLKEERSIRNKFARIRFETDKYIQKTETLNQQLFWIIAFSLISTGGLILLYNFRVSRARNKELILEKEQQKSNEHIYELLLLQQAKVEEGRFEERKRISSDLHDGVLGRLFGTRMNLGFLDREKNLDSHLTELQEIEKEIRDISHNLINKTIVGNNNFNSLVEEIIREKEKVSGISFKLEKDTSSGLEDLSYEKKIHLIRLLQESLQNILKHSKAQNARVQLFERDSWVCLVINDDGEGFDARRDYKGIGFKNINYRIQKIKGYSEIKSSNNGTQLIFKIPV